MKLITFFLTICIIQISANGFSQSQKISVNVKNYPLEKVFQEIEKQTKFRFLYRMENVEKVTVDLSANNSTLEQILDKLLNNRNITYRILENNLIVITPVESLQNKKITGTIKDATNGDPLPGVNITVEGTTIGVVSDAEGRYTIEVPSSSSILVFSFVGYNTEKLELGGRNTLDVQLVVDVTKLEEVVVVGYGTMKKSDLTGAVVSVSSEDIKKSMSTSLDQSLQGRAAGVSVIQNSGQPGGGVSVSIRGINSLTQGNEPLYVIDGVPISSNFGAGVGGNMLSTINPVDIVSMEVLKDASSAAIYGSRAANGVILITTRKGEKGKTKVNYDASMGWQKVAKKLDMLNLREYAQFDNDRSTALGFIGQPALKNPSILGEGTDWQDAIFKTAPISSHQLSVSGGNEKTVYSLSFGYLNQDGIIIGSNFKRYSGRLNVENNTTNWLKIGANIMVSQANEDVNATYWNGTLTTLGSTLITALNMTPDVPLKNPDGSWGGYTDEQMKRAGSTAFIDPNPAFLSSILKNDIKKSSVVGRVYAEISLMKGLTLRNEFGGTSTFAVYDQFVPTYTNGIKVNPNNLAFHQASNAYNWTLNSYLTFNKSFGTGTNLTVMAAHESYLNQSQLLSASTPNLPSNYVNNVNLGDMTKVKLSDYVGNDALESYFGRMVFSWKDKYLLTTTLRTDGSSKFGPNNKWGTFPSAALGWKISNEPFFKNVRVVDNLKLRLSYGSVGNSSIPLGTYISALSTTVTHWGTGFLNGNINNPNVQWESTTSEDIGIDLNMFKNRIEFIFDAYIKETDNLLLPLALPRYSGTTGNGSISTPYVNIGKLENKGLDFTLSTINITSPLTWKTSFTFSLNRNKVKKLNSENGVYDNSLDYAFTRTAIGQPVGQFYGYQTDGLFKTGEEVTNSALPTGTPINEGAGVWVGDIKFRNLNSDNVIDEKDRAYIGNPNPKWTAGLTNSFSYKGVELSIFITGVYGNKIYNTLRNRLGAPKKYQTGLREIGNFAKITLIDPSKPRTIDNVKLENPGTTVFRVRGDYNSFDTNTSDYWVEDGSYLRVKNIVLSYNLPGSLTDKIHVENVRVYGSIQNALTFTKYSGYDPEIGGGNVMLNGIDFARYPSARTFTVGINVNF
jgi:TonB-dependent starch-binding outer membrane protein SusC